MGVQGLYTERILKTTLTPALSVRVTRPTSTEVNRAPMKIAVLSESYPGERRVALVPANVPTLTKAGAQAVSYTHLTLPTKA